MDNHWKYLLYAKVSEIFYYTLGYRKYLLYADYTKYPLYARLQKVSVIC